MPLRTTLLVVLLMAFSHSAKLPQTFTRCARKSPDFSTCLPKAIQDAVRLMGKPFPDLGIRALEPLELTELYMGAGTGAVSVVQTFKDILIHGFLDIQIKRFDIDFKTKEFYIDCMFPKMIKEANYTLDGKVLMLPVVGEGRSKIVVDNFHIKINVKFEIIKKHGDDYLKVESANGTMDASHLGLHFDNLFNGNQAMGDNINKVLNDNWKEVLDDVKDGYAKAMCGIFKSVSNEVFSRVKVTDLFLD